MQASSGREFLKRAEFGASRWPGGPWPAAVAEARASLLLAEGGHRNACGRPAPRRRGYAANGQLLGERRAREPLERLRTAKINA